MKELFRKRLAVQKFALLSPCGNCAQLLYWCLSEQISVLVGGILSWR